jgi:heat shock protein HtpX
MDNLFSTHPATENRIAALEAMSREGVGRAAQPSVEPPKANPWGRNPTGPKGPWS